MTVHPQGQCFQTLQEYPGIVGRQAGTQVAQRDESHPHNEGNRIQVPEIVGVAETMIALIRFVVQGEFRIRPVKFTRIDNNTADSGTMPPHPFGQGVDDDISTVFDGSEQIGRCKGPVDNQRQLMLPGNCGDCLDIGNFQHRIADGLDENTFCFIRKRGLEICRIAGIDKIGVNVELRQNRIEHGVGAAI